MQAKLGKAAWQETSQSGLVSVSYLSSFLTPGTSLQ